MTSSMWLTLAIFAGHLGSGTAALQQEGRSSRTITPDDPGNGSALLAIGSGGQVMRSEKMATSELAPGDDYWSQYVAGYEAAQKAENARDAAKAAAAAGHHPGHPELDPAPAPPAPVPQQGPVIRQSTTAQSATTTTAAQQQAIARDAAQTAKPALAPSTDASVAAAPAKQSTPIAASSQPVAPPVSGKRSEPLSPWAQWMILSVVMWVVIAVWWFVKSKVTDPVPRGAGSSELERVLNGALERVRSLEDQLETQREVDAMFQESDGEDEPVGEASAQGNDAAAEVARRTREIQEAASKTAEQSEALLQGASRAQEVFTSQVNQARDTVESFAREQTSGLYEKVNKAVQEKSENIPMWDPPEWLSADGTLQLPPLRQLLSGLLATSQIRATRFFNKLCMMLGVSLVTLSAVTFAVDWKNDCKDRSVWVWHIGLLSLMVCDTFCRYLIVRRADDSIHSLTSDNEELDTKDNLSNSSGLFSFMAAFQRRGSHFFDGFFAYNGVLESMPYVCARICSAVILLWGGFGLHLSINNIVLDSVACNATTAVMYMHVYSFFYVLLLTWALLGGVLYILNIISDSTHVRTPIVQYAKSYDDDTMKGVPVMLTLVQSFVLKESSELYALKVKQAIKEINELEEAERELEQKLRARTTARDKFNELSQSSPNEQEFMDRIQQRVLTGLDEIKPIVGLVAANVTTEAVPDPTAAAVQSPFQAEPVESF